MLTIKDEDGILSPILMVLKQVDAEFPLIYDIKRQLYIRKNIEIEKQSLSLQPKPAALDREDLHDCTPLNSLIPVPSVLCLRRARSKMFLILRVNKLKNTKQSNSPNIWIEAFEQSSVFWLQELLAERLKVPAENLLIYYRKKKLEKRLRLTDYDIKPDDINPGVDSGHFGGQKRKIYELTVVEFRSNSSGRNLHTENTPASSNSFSLAIDFSFNNIQTVKKVSWQESAPWYREVQDGFCWIAYCKNMQCKCYKEMVIINKGYGTFNLNNDKGAVSCPLCEISATLSIRNCGFVNSEWEVRGVLSRVSGALQRYQDKTYDGQLYTLKEMDFKSSWISFVVQCKRLPESEI